MFLETFFGICIMILILFVRHILIRKQHPPGPLGFPLLGQTPARILPSFFPSFISKISEVEYFKRMKEKYGDIWSMEIGSVRIIVIASLDAMVEAFVDNAKLFSGRPIHGSYQIVSENLGILFVDGDLWQGNRQLAIKALRDLGMGKRDMETQICNEVDELIEYICKNLSSPIRSPHLFVKAVSNIISRLAFNERNRYDDPELERYVKNLNNMSHLDGAQQIINLCPKLLQTKLARALFPAVDHYLNSVRDTIRFVTNKCISRITIEEECSKPDCVFDYFWRYRYQDDPGIKYDEKLLSISHSLFDIFNAGIDTTTNMLGFGCLMLGHYQDLQKELKTEIQLLADDYKLLNMDMRKDCPKLLSFIDEVQRYCYLVPKVHHRVLETCMFRGYEIRPTDLIFGDLATISRDSNLFVNPDFFDPYRFMDKTKTKYIQNKSLIPFGIGKRSCLGEGIAVMEIFLFFSKIIHTFEISLPNITKERMNEIVDGNCNIVHAPLDHEIIFKQYDRR